MEEDKPIKGKKEDRTSTVVLAQLPKQDIRELVTEDGTRFEALTIEEALTEILETTRQLKRGLL